ncbi:MAG TPA: OmpA family protein [Acidobacteria bacterium]|nr:OmpA family protein [Acidobacteriota bacterium]
MMKYRASFVLAVGLALVLATGCVSNKKFETAVSDVTSRIDDVQGSVEENSAKIDQLSEKDRQIEQQVTAVDGKVGQAQQTSQAAMEKAEQAAKTARGKVIWKVTLTNRDVLFGVDDAEVTPAGAAALDNLVSRLKSYDKMVFVEIQGHTDSSGGEAYNRALGLKRAEVVRDYLHEQGIPLNLLSVISYGESRPVADNSTREGRAANRRVEILVLE